MIHGLSLFSGIGGFELALAPWVSPVAYCEIDPYCQAVLLSRMADGSLPRAPIWPDVRTLPVEELPPVDIVYGGFPCQDISVAGSGAGLDGGRSGLIFDLLDIARRCEPRFIFLENVPALAVRGLDRVLLGLHALGYDARWTIVSASEVGAPHLRERIWILAHADRERVRELPGGRGGSHRDGPAKPVYDGEDGALADSDVERLEVRQQGCARELAAAFGGSWWATEPDVGRVAHGIPRRVDRVRALGNSIVPQAAREAFIRLGGIDMTRAPP